jgi:cytochrome c oxidase subunit 2
MTRFVLGFLGIFALAFADDGASKNMPAALWDQLNEIWLILSVVIYLIVAIPSLIFMIKYRYKEGEREFGDQEHEGHWGLEALWTIVPLIIVIYLATHGFAIFKEMRTVPKDAFELKVTAFMWGWEFEYPNGKKVYAFFKQDKDPVKGYTAQEFEKPLLPVGKPIKVSLTSKDVIHAFYLRPAKVTQDAVPGRITYIWFQVNEEGEYWVFCREYCGTWHSRMFAKIKFVPEAEFNQWLSGQANADKSHRTSQLEQTNIYATKGGAL